MPKLKVITQRLLKGLTYAVGIWIILVLAIRILQNTALIQIEELTKTRIEVHSVDFDLNGSVLLENLVIRPDREPRYDDAILRAKKAYARFGLGSLLLLRPRLKEIRLHDFDFNAQYDLDSRLWNVAELKIKASTAATGKMPLVLLNRGKLRYSKVKNARIKTIASVPIDARFGPAGRHKKAYCFRITTARAPGTTRKSSLTGIWRQGFVSVNGGVSSTDLPAFEKAWSINNLALQFYYDLSHNYALRLKIKELLSKQEQTAKRVTLARPQFLERLGIFTMLEKFFNSYKPAGLIDVSLEATGNLHDLAQSELAGKIYCKDVSICYEKFPYAIEHLAGRVDFTEKNVLLNNISGRHGNVELLFNGFVKGFGADKQQQIRITSGNIVFDNDLYAALSRKQKKLWSAFSPGGLAAIDYKISRKSENDRSETLTVELLDGNAAYRNFPYLLKKLKGTILFEKHRITISDIVSQWQDRWIKLNGQVTELNKERPCWNVSIKAGDIPLDSTLITSLPEKQRHIFNRFDTGGKVRIGELTGEIWKTEKIEQPQYQFVLKSEQLNLDDNLLGLLPAKLKGFVSRSKPKGKVDVSVYLECSDVRSAAPDYKVAVDCLKNSICLEPGPYHLNDICGTLLVAKNTLELQNITAVIDNAEPAMGKAAIKADGKVSIVENKFGKSNLRFSAENIQLNDRLGCILPKGARRLYTTLKPSGLLDLNVDNLIVSEPNNNVRTVSFDATAEVKNCTIKTHPLITQLNATLKTEGIYNNDTGLNKSRVKLYADSLRIKAMRLTKLKADVFYDPDNKRWFSDNLIAHSHDGRLTGKFAMAAAQQENPRYVFHVGFNNIDLRQFLQDNPQAKANDRDSTTGTMKGDLSLAGTVGDHYSNIGRCRFSITDMQVGKLSPLARLLTILKLTEPSDFAFEKMFVDSFINKKKVLFRKFDLSGPRVAFNGSGRMDLESENIDLRLTARGERLATGEPSLLSSLTEGLGHAVVRMDVSGSIHEPLIETKTLPVIGETLRILGTKSTERTR